MVQLTNKEVKLTASIYFFVFSLHIHSYLTYYVSVYTEKYRKYQYFSIMKPEENTQFFRNMYSLFTCSVGKDIIIGTVALASFLVNLECYFTVCNAVLFTLWLACGYVASSARP